MTRESIISGITDILNLSKVGIVPPSVFISGSVGSGKTFLLHECLEKTDVDFGTIRSGEIYSSRLLVEAFLNAVKGFLICLEIQFFKKILIILSELISCFSGYRRF